MSTEKKSINLGIVVWLNLIIGIYNMYTYQQDNTILNLFIGAINIGVWVFLRNNSLRIAYLKGRLNR
ncbi:MAG: hypothetical protein CMG00_04965 [Candidatus Marinimicrobia bacterium]|nr:hypothetical protein [Candidatus Neomarinimicrobiota bacterium]|tara:strand:+ start:1573 stop:1773 length:201 start_codon:yes stop_codon:yes gene_type:complete